MQLHALPLVGEDGVELLLQGLGAQCRSVDDIIRHFPQGLEHLPLLGNGVHQADRIAGQGMIPAGLLVAAEQHVVPSLQEQGLDLIADVPRLSDQGGHGVGVEELAAAHVHREGHKLALQGRAFAGLHELHHHHGRQVIHTERAQILQITGGDGLAAAAHPGHKQETQTDSSLSYNILIPHAPGCPRPGCAPQAPASRRSAHTPPFEPSPSAPGNPPRCRPCSPGSPRASR